VRFPMDGDGDDGVSGGVGGSAQADVGGAQRACEERVRAEDDACAPRCVRRMLVARCTGGRHAKGRHGSSLGARRA
jgi:hypothetical protein